MAFLFLISLAIAIIGNPFAALAQKQDANRPAPIDPAKGESEARKIVAEILAQKPAENGTNTGQIRIRDRDGNERVIPARFEVIATPTNWLSIYETLDPTGKAATTKLAVTHTEGAPNRYQLTEIPAGGGANVTVKELTPEEAMVPFAGSDFWVADLGLDFLHWPKQRVVMRDMRHSKSCNVLETINPHPAPGGYARVESWIIIEGPRGVVHADAYDAQNQKMKEFDPVNLEKDNQGQYQLEEMEMRNRQTGSHTWIKFDVQRN